MGPIGVRATSPPRCDYTSRVRFTQTYRDGRGSQEVSIAPSLDSNRLRIGRNGPIIALWAAVQPAKSLILGTSGLIDPPGPRLRPPDLYIIRKLSERRIRLSNNTKFDNVALNANFITSAHDILEYIWNSATWNSPTAPERGWGNYMRLRVPHYIHYRVSLSQSCR